MGHNCWLVILKISNSQVNVLDNTKDLLSHMQKVSVHRNSSDTQLCPNITILLILFILLKYVH